MENKGYTLAGLAARLQKLESAWKSYTALQILATTKGWKWSVLETKVFGKDKPSSTYRNCRKLAEKVFASAFHAGHREAVVGLGLDEAVEYTLRVMDAHMTALGVTNQKDYTALAHFAGKEEMPAPEPEASEPEAAPEAEAAPEPEASEPEAPKSTMELAISAMEALSLTELATFARLVNERIISLNETEKAMAKKAA